MNVMRIDLRMKEIILACFILMVMLSMPLFAKIPAKEFFFDPNILTAEMSPNGKWVATVRGVGDEQKLVLSEVSSGEITELIKLSEFSEKKSSIEAISWIDNGHIAAQFSQRRKGIKNLIDTQNIQNLLVIKIPLSEGQNTQILSVRTSGWFVNPLRNEKGVFLYAKSSVYSKIYKINVAKLNPYKQKLTKLMRRDGGQFVKSNEVASSKGFATKWFIDSSGKPKAVMHYIETGELQLSRIDDKLATVSLKKWNFSQIEKRAHTSDQVDKLIIPIALSEDRNTFYCLDLNEDRQRSVYKVNFKVDHQELVYESNDFGIIDLILEPSNNSLIGVKIIKNSEIRNIYLESEEPDDFVLSHFKNFQIKSKLATSINQTASLVYSENHNRPGQFWWVSKNLKNKQLIGSRFPRLDGRLNSRQIEATLKVDGLEISYILTRPKYSKNTKFPLIVIPHGGPIGVYDSPYFNLGTQFFAANNFAVLRVNYRGSGGYSLNFRDKGKRQWGDLILRDIYQATQKVVTRNDIDESKVCIFGMSYGGYAALMLSIEHPELYRCAISVAGVSDVNYMLNTPNKTLKQDLWMKDNIGNTLTEYESLKSISPLYQIDKLSRPLFIIHGMKDEIVDVEHAFRLKHMLEKYNKPFEWLIFPEGIHDYGDSKDQVLLFSQVQEFIERSL